MKTAIMMVMAAVMGMALLGEASEQPPPVPQEEQPEVLTRGPLNEAFAQPVNLEDRTGLVAPTAPPANIEEIPPEQKPAGDQFVWAPGYWAWDSDRNGYIWVSGCWRAAPPNMHWIPGYWTKTTGGWQWVAGFWGPVGNQEIEYLPPPPALTDVAPPGPAPSPDRIWVPPVWYWNNGQYIRRPGYWIAAQEDWIWVPSHYVWTPRGYVFVTGRWDYSLRRRGVLFAPVYFPGPVYERPGFSYPLNIIVDVDNLEFGLFTRPRYSHYYFGDYYDTVYVGMGIFPWYEWEGRHTWYDPIYVHDRWRHRADVARWEANQRQEYDRRRADPSLRPPRTYGEMERRLGKMPESRRRNLEIASPISGLVARKTSTFGFEQIKPESRQQISRHSSNVHKFVEDRNRWESQGAAPTKAGRPVTERIPPAERKGPEPKAAMPAEQMRHGETPGSGRTGLTTSPEQQGPMKISPREAKPYQSDKVRVSTSPVVGKQEGDSFGKRVPSRPAEEHKTKGQEKAAEREIQRGNNAGRH